MTRVTITPARNEGTFIGVTTTPSANPLDVANLVHAEVKAMQPTLPEGPEAGKAMIVLTVLRKLLTTLWATERTPETIEPTRLLKNCKIEPPRERMPETAVLPMFFSAFLAVDPTFLTLCIALLAALL